MRNGRCLVASMFLVSVSVAAGAHAADEPLTAMQTAVACAIPPTIDLPAPDALRIVGAQDTAPRLLYGPDDLLVIEGGTARNLELGQRFFVRRTDWFGPYGGGTGPHATRTAGWIRIVAVNETTSMAAVEHVCTGMMEGDYLEPFVAPAVPATANRNDASGDLDFKDLGHVGYGERLRTTGGIGDFMLIDRGADQNTETGARFAVYRDVHKPGVPLAPVGEAVVVSVGRALSVVRITAARDAIDRGDFIVPRR